MNTQYRQTGRKLTSVEFVGIAEHPDAERFTESELIAADLEYGCNKAAKAHEAQERSAMRLQINDKTGAYE